MYNPNQEDLNGDGIGDDCDGVGLQEHQFEWNVYPNPSLLSQPFHLTMIKKRSLKLIYMMKLKLS